MTQNSVKIFLVLFLLNSFVRAQTPSCPSPYVYMDGATNIRYYDPVQPISATNPGTLNIPVATSGTNVGAGLTLMPNINGGTLSPTFYTTLMGNYWYWNGSSWVNTGHSTGNASASNIAGCGSAIYNLVGGNGQVYVYNGTGNGTYLTTLSNFSGSGPYDLVADCNCNFYALNTSTPNQALTLYNSSGNIICSYSLSGMPNTNAGGGFAIIGNMIYVKNNVSTGFFVGTISGASVTFTAVNSFTPGASDFASCPVCIPTPTLSNVSISNGGIIGCVTPSLNLYAYATNTTLNYSWSGPGIVGAANNSVVTVNAAGTYTCVVSTTACPPVQTSLTAAVISNSTNVVASITPSGNVCMSGNTPLSLVANHPSSNDIISWSGPGILSGTSSATLTTGNPGVFSVVVTDAVSGCSTTATVNIVQSPTISVTLSNSSVCAQPLNGSPASIQMMPSGASNYAVLTSANFSISTTGTVVTCFPKPPFSNSNSMATATIVGTNQFCVDTLITAFLIVPNPTINISPSSSSICPYNSQSLTVSGAGNYTWSQAASLNTLTGAAVVANPSASAVYSVFGGMQGCNSATKNTTVTVMPLPAITISPPNLTVCAGSTLGLSALGNANAYTWSPSFNLSSASSSFVITYPVQSQVYSVVAALNSCTTTASASITVVQPPGISIALSANSVCAHPYFNSPNAITVTPSGANTYTLLGSSNLFIQTATGTSMNVVPTGNATSTMVVASLTLQGNSGVCTVATTKTFAIIDNPVVGITPQSTSICPGSSQMYVLSGASNYTWTPDPSLFLTSPNSAVASPAATSFYGVYGSANGCFSDLRNAVLVVLPNPTVAISPLNYTVCAGSTLALNAQGNALNYSWFEHNLPTGSNGLNTLVTPTVNTIYTIVAYIGTCTNSAVATVSAIPVPAINVSAKNPTVCMGDNTLLNASGAMAYVWSPPATLNQSSGNAVIATPMGNTTYTVQGYNGLCTGVGTIEITTLNRPVVEINAEVNTVCAGKTLSLSAKGAQNYIWLPNDATNYNNTGPLVVMKPKTNTNYTLIASNYMGTVSCNANLNYSVLVLDPPQVFTTGSVGICSGQKTTIKATGGTAYFWAPSTGLNANTNAAVVANPTTSTVYTVGVSYGGYCGTTATLLVQVNPKPGVFAGTDTTINLNEPLFLSASGSGSLTWIAGEGITCNDCPYTRVFPTQNGCYVVEAKNEFNCTMRDEVCVTVTKEYSLYMPNSFTPNKDGLNDVLYVYGENLSRLSLEIYDRWGQLIFESNDQALGWDGTVKGTECMNGTYVYKLSYKGLDGKTYNKVGNVLLMR